MKSTIATLSIVVLMSACSKKSDSAVRDHVDTTTPSMVVTTTSAEAGKVNKLIETLMQAGLTNSAPAGSSKELYNAQEFGVEAVTKDETSASIVTMFRSEGQWHRSNELSGDKDFDYTWTDNLANGNLDGGRSFKCGIAKDNTNPFATPGYVLPLLSCSREAGKPETAVCTATYRCITQD